MAEFKIGDFVSATVKAAWTPNWQNCEIIGVSPNVKIYTVKNPKGEIGSVDWDQVEKANYKSPEPTPEELAEEYRRLRGEARHVFMKLHELGFKAFFNGVAITISPGCPTLWTFEKTITEKIVV